MNFGPVSINLLGFKVNVIDHTAVLSMGSIKQIDIFVSYKRTQGIGEQNGDFSPILNPYSFVTDSDFSDSPTAKYSVL